MNPSHTPLHEMIEIRPGGPVGPVRRRTSKVLKAVAFVAVGALVGAGIALLFAPTKGADLRKKIGRQLSAARQKLAIPLHAIGNRLGGVKLLPNEQHSLSSAKHRASSVVDGA